MRMISAPIVLLGLVVGVSVYGCSSDSGGGPASRGSAGPRELTAACSVDELSAPPTSGPPTVAAGSGKGKVGVIVPQTPGLAGPSSTDIRLVTKALHDRGISAEAATPANPSAFVAAAQRMIDRGATVLILDPIDDPSGVEAERAARRAGVEVIDYDHLTLGGSARYYVSFDAESIGRLQAETLIDCLAQQGIADPRVIILDGGTNVDNGAVLQDKGVHEVLDPLVAAGRATIEEEAAVKGWRAARAAPTFLVALDASNGQVDGVVAASDGIADAVIGVLARDGRDGNVALTGQGSGVQGLRHILTGQQSMTVFDDPRAEADAAARLAVTLVAGRNPSAAGLSLAPYTDPQSPRRTVRALLLPGQVITRANVQDLVDSGAVTTTQLCAGILGTCAALGLH